MENNLCNQISIKVSFGFPYCLFLPQTLKAFKKNGQIYPGLFHSNIQFLRKFMFFCGKLANALYNSLGL